MKVWRVSIGDWLQDSPCTWLKEHSSLHHTSLSKGYFLWRLPNSMRKESSLKPRGKMIWQLCQRLHNLHIELLWSRHPRSYVGMHHYSRATLDPTMWLKPPQGLASCPSLGQPIQAKLETWPKLIDSGTCGLNLPESIFLRPLRYGPVGWGH